MPPSPKPAPVKKLTLAEQYLASAKRIDPEGVDAILRARVAAAALVEEGGLFVTDLEEFKRILGEEFEKDIAVTNGVADGLDIDAMRAKGHATQLRLAGSPAVGELLGKLTEDGIRAMAKSVIRGRDGAMGIASQIAQKYPGTWRLASYLIEDDFQSVTRYTDVKMADGSIETGRVDAPSGKVVKIYVELIETSGAPPPRYENGRLVGEAVGSSSPELAEATAALADAVRAFKGVTQQPPA